MIVNFNQIVAHFYISKTGHLRCCLYRLSSPTKTASGDQILHEGRQDSTTSQARKSIKWIRVPSSTPMKFIRFWESLQCWEKCWRWVHGNQGMSTSQWKPWKCSNSPCCTDVQCLRLSNWTLEQTVRSCRLTTLQTYHTMWVWIRPNVLSVRHQSSVSATNPFIQSDVVR